MFITVAAKRQQEQGLTVGMNSKQELGTRRHVQDPEQTQMNKKRQSASQVVRMSAITSTIRMETITNENLGFLFLLVLA